MEKIIRGFKCPICKKIYETKLKTIDGLVVDIESNITVGYSEGGWGRRRNHISFSDEVCGKCYDKAMNLLEPLRKFLEGKK